MLHPRRHPRHEVTLYARPRVHQREDVVICKDKPRQDAGVRIRSNGSHATHHAVNMRAIRQHGSALRTAQENRPAAAVVVVLDVLNLKTVPLPQQPVPKPIPTRALVPQPWPAVRVEQVTTVHICDVHGIMRHVIFQDARIVLIVDDTRSKGNARTPPPRRPTLSLGLHPLLPPQLLKTTLIRIETQPERIRFGLGHGLELGVADAQRPSCLLPQVPHALCVLHQPNHLFIAIEIQALPPPPPHPQQQPYADPLRHRRHHDARDDQQRARRLTLDPRQFARHRVPGCQSERIVLLLCPQHRLVVLLELIVVHKVLNRLLPPPLLARLPGQCRAACVVISRSKPPRKRPVQTLPLSRLP